LQWALSLSSWPRTTTTRLAVTALRSVIALRQPVGSTIIHSDLSSSPPQP
jgi:hypothetical protein